MCDYSLAHVRSRAAVKGEKLVVHNFGCMTRGFRAAADDVPGQGATAVCLLPGTEVAFREPVVLTGIWEKASQFAMTERVATFAQIDTDQPFRHHDALRFKDDEVKLLTSLVDGQQAVVLQLPAVVTERVKVPELAAIFG